MGWTTLQESFWFIVDLLFLLLCCFVMDVDNLRQKGGRGIPLIWIIHVQWWIFQSVIPWGSEVAQSLLFLTWPVHFVVQSIMYADILLDGIGFTVQYFPNRTACDGIGSSGDWRSVPFFWCHWKTMWEMAWRVDCEEAPLPDGITIILTKHCKFL